MNETEDYNTFSYGVGDRSASIRIPTATKADGFKGYIEDRRPASNIDPYLATAILVDTTILEQSMYKGMEEHIEKWSLWKKANPCEV